MTTEEFKHSVIPMGRKLYPMVFRILRNEEESKDALQELMLRLWNKREELSACRNQSAYILTMAKNFCLDALKKKRPVSIGNEEFRMLNLRDTSPSQETMEKFEIVHRIINELPQKYKDILQHREIDGLSFEEISALTGLEITNIRVILSRARATVKSEVEKIYSYDETERVAQKIL